MLETVRIRRAGYNVRLTYEEFIQLYRILLPKGLLSSQKDVRDFMNHFMDLNKQHYQLGATKIYMRENQKMRLDIRLHTKIIESIVCIQRWFRSILQRRKFLQQKQAVITLQSNWRMFVAKQQVQHRRAYCNGAAIIIQSKWRMYVERKKYLKLQHSIVLIQAHIRGKLARIKFQTMLKQRQKHMRERQKLRSTQSLPVHERIVEAQFEPVKRVRTPTPHYSLDSDIELCQDPEDSPSHRMSKQKRDQMLDQTEQQIKNLLIHKDEYFRKSSVPSIDPFLSYQPPPPSFRQEDVMDVGKVYDVEKAMRRNEEGETLKRFDVTKMPIRRVDSGPARREIQRSDNGIRPIPATDVEIVFVNTTLPSSSRTGPYNQQYSLDTLPQRRDIVCRSLNEEYQNYQPPIVYHQPQTQSQHENRATITATTVAPKGKCRLAGMCKQTFIGMILFTLLVSRSFIEREIARLFQSRETLIDCIDRLRRSQNNLKPILSDMSCRTQLSKLNKDISYFSRRKSRCTVGNDSRSIA